MTKEEIKAKNKQRKAHYKRTKTNSFYTLYYLPEEHYVGMSQQPKIRLQNHKSAGKHVLDYEVIGTFKNKRECLTAEHYMHSIGYNGTNPAKIK